ncbi:PREDICTED: autoimmune regulator-like [Ficedula albicollis]|uniref:autoimmune regulator-like n=1 Tax=Ficedula albicollis TaxID=59894 RepID=UPI0007AD82BD|nr:PREDICTED: autoimmune regulator-like [Ficedula albicollis]
MAGPGSDGDLRRLLKLHRTEIAMAVDDVFPLLHGLADHDVVPEHIFKETLGRTEREGSHRAFHALLTWLLGRDTAALRDFWVVLFKDYNLERYSRLRPLRAAFPREVELGRQRRGRRLSPSPTAPAPHRPQGKRKAPEDRDKARAAQPAPRHSTSPGPLVKAKTVKKPEGTETPRTSRASGSSKTGSRAGDEPYNSAACEEPEARSRSHSLKLPCQGCEGEFFLHGIIAMAWGLSPSASSASPNLFLSHQQNRETQLHTQGQMPAATVYSQDPVPHQENEDECAACGDGGELICCDGCPRAFHLACLVPPLPHVPSGTWRCGSCVGNVTEPGQLLEAVLPVEKPPEILGEAARDTQAGGVEGSICSRCCTRIPTPRHCPAPSGDPRGLLLCMSCTGTPDTGGLGTPAAAGDQLLPAAKVSTSSARNREGEEEGEQAQGREGDGRTYLHAQAEDGALGSDPMLSRDELDALLGEVRLCVTPRDRFQAKKALGSEPMLNRDELDALLGEGKKAYSTRYSQAVSHPSTNRARPCLASEIRRDRAFSGWYGRRHPLTRLRRSPAQTTTFPPCSTASHTHARTHTHIHTTQTLPLPRPTSPSISRLDTKKRTLCTAAQAQQETSGLSKAAQAKRETSSPSNIKSLQHPVFPGGLPSKY